MCGGDGRGGCVVVMEGEGRVDVHISGFLTLGG